MPTQDELALSEMANILKRVREEAFAAGWAACRDHMLSLTPQKPSGKATPTSVSIERPAPNRRERAPWGSVPKAIKRAVNEQGEAGISVGIVRQAAMADGNAIADSSIRSWLSDMTEDGQLTVRNGRWFKTAKFVPSKDETAGYDHESSPAAPLDHNQGGSDERTALAH